MPIKVRLADRSYPIFIERGLSRRAGKIIRAQKFPSAKTATTAVLVTDRNVNRKYGVDVGQSLRSAGFSRVIRIVLPPGERTKTLQNAEKVFNQMIRAGVHRDAVLVALGGGVIGDLAGFVAATYMRGIALVQVPTTLVAMVDSAIGGKTAVNHPQCKNLIGVFYQPVCVISDPDVLRTLPLREIRTGMAEVIKYGIIQDPTLFRAAAGFGRHALDNPRHPFYMLAIRRGSQIKADVVSRDERETGLRMILNFGHTFGHAIEEATGYKTLNHGEAISIGMIAASRLGARMRLCDQSVPRRIEKVLGRIGLPVRKSLPLQKIVRLLQMDKKIRENKVNFVLPRRIGQVSVTSNVSNADVRAVLQSVGCS